MCLDYMYMKGSHSESRRDECMSDGLRQSLQCFFTSWPQESSEVPVLVDYQMRATQAGD